jgi:hypothetical protein
MSLSNSWRIVRNTGFIAEELQPGKGGTAAGARRGTRAAAGARPGATQDRRPTDNAEAKPQTR